MKKRPFLLASATLGGVFLFFLLVLVTAGYLRSGLMIVPGGDKIGIIEIDGAIVDAGRVIRRIDEFRHQSSIKAVILRINSPGGGVAPSQEIYTELKRLAQEKPLIVSMGSVAASGGYYLAVAGDYIFASPGTITGSIGVIMSFPNYGELMEKIGIQEKVVKSGQFKDVGSATRDFSEADRALLQDLINDVHQQFVQAVMDERKLEPESLMPITDGRIFTGRQARDLGLIDALGTFNDAVDYAAKKVGLGTEPPLVYPRPDKEKFWEPYLDSALSRYLGLERGAGRLTGPQYLWQLK